MAPKSTSEAFTPRLELYDPDGVLVVDTAGGYVARIGNYQTLKTGFYTIVCSSVGMGAGEYCMSLIITADPTTSPEDPDGGCIVSGESRCGSISTAADIDAYPFYCKAGHGVASKFAPNSTSEAFTPRLELYDPDGIRVVDTAGGYVARIGDYQTLKTGFYTIVCSSIGMGAGEYSMSLVLTSGPTTSPLDRDGGYIVSGEKNCGSISTPGDIDARAWYGESGQGISAKMTPNSPSDAFTPRLELYDPDGFRVVDTAGGYVAGIGDYQLLRTGIYTLVCSSVGVGTGEYCVTVAVMPPKDPNGLYPYDPQPADGQSINYCDPNHQFSDAVIENRILPDENIIERLRGAYFLSWWSVLGATGYDVFFASGPCMPLEKLAENVADPWVSMPALEGNTVYYWQVVAHTPSGDIQGPTWWFSVEPCDCSLKISTIGQGSIIDPNEGFYEYPCEEVVSVTAVADTNYEFVRWEGTAVDANKIIIKYQDPTGSQVLVTVDDAYTLTAVFEEIIYDISLDTDPGWTMEGQWEFGIPTGQQCGPYGYPDPNSGRTGRNVIGVNLNGCYNTDLGDPYSVTTGPFELKGYKDVKLRFWQWLNTDWAEYVENSFETSPDENTWDRIWQNPKRDEITENEWTYVEYYYPGSWPDDEPILYLRWSYQVVKERANAYTGWNIDDIQFIGRK
jgi:hypothetical protein